MNREELRTRSFDHTGVQGYYKIEVDELLNEIESRTCENCKHFHKTIDNYGECYNGVFHNSLTDVETNFGCNKWEAKDSPNK